MLRILVVDDETTVRKGIILGVDWAALDCTVVGEAANGLEALEAAEACKPDLIISDIRMPKMDGLELARNLRERGNNCSMIFLTAYGEFDYARSALQLGAADYLLKPFRDQELAAAIDRVRARSAVQKNAEDDEPMLERRGKSKYVQQAMAYIAEHYHDADISITTIASDLNVSEGHLSHIFKRETGSTVIAYLTQYRMHKARELLRDYRCKIYEVAEKVGYRDVSYFSSIFKKVTGVSPSEYQNKI